MGEPKSPHFYDFWIFETVTKPPNQVFLFSETPGHLKQSRQIPKHFLKNMSFINIGIVETENLDNVRKDGHRQIMKIRPIKS